MLHVYRQLAHRLGTHDAVDLANELTGWHDRMVRHDRMMKALGRRRCEREDDGCAHDEARDLWRRAQAVFGADAFELVFLQRSAMAGAGDESA